VHHLASPTLQERLESLKPDNDSRTSGASPLADQNQVSISIVDASTVKSDLSVAPATGAGAQPPVSGIPTNNNGRIVNGSDATATKEPEIKDNFGSLQATFSWDETPMEPAGPPPRRTDHERKQTDKPIHTPSVSKSMSIVRPVKQIGSTLSSSSATLVPIPLLVPEKQRETANEKSPAPSAPFLTLPKSPPSPSAPQAHQANGPENRNAAPVAVASEMKPEWNSLHIVNEEDPVIIVDHSKVQRPTDADLTEFARSIRFHNNADNPLIIAFLQSLEKHCPKVTDLGDAFDGSLWLKTDASNIRVVSAIAKLDLITHINNRSIGWPVSLSADGLLFPITCYSYQDFYNTYAKHGTNTPLPVSVKTVVHSQIVHKTVTEAERKRCAAQLEINSRETRRQEVIDAITRMMNDSFNSAPGCYSWRDKRTTIKIDRVTVLNEGPNKRFLVHSGSQSIAADADLLEVRPQYLWVLNYSTDRTSLSMMTERAYTHVAMQRILTRTNEIPQFIKEENGDFCLAESIGPGVSTVYGLGAGAIASKIISSPLALLGNISKNAKLIFNSDTKEQTVALLRQPETSKWTTWYGYRDPVVVPSALSSKNIRLKSHTTLIAVFGIITTHGDMAIRAKLQSSVPLLFSYELLLDCMNNAPVFQDFRSLRAYAMTSVLNFCNDYAPHQRLECPVTLTQGTQYVLEHLLARQVECETAGTQGFLPGLLLPY